VPDRPQVALAVLDVDGIKPDDGRVRSQIDLADMLTQDKRTTIVMDELLEPVERSKDSWNRLVVVCLSGRASGLVNASVEIWLHPGSDLVNPRPQSIGV
jgi:hypothetical protein